MNRLRVEAYTSVKLHARFRSQNDVSGWIRDVACSVASARPALRPRPVAVGPQPKRKSSFFFLLFFLFFFFFFFFFHCLFFFFLVLL